MHVDEIKITNSLNFFNLSTTKQFAMVTRKIEDYDNEKDIKTLKIENINERRLLDMTTLKRKRVSFILYTISAFILMVIQ